MYGSPADEQHRYVPTTADLIQAFHGAQSSALHDALNLALAEQQGPQALLNDDRAELAACDREIVAWLDEMALLPRDQLVQCIYTIQAIGAGSAIDDALETICTARECHHDY